MIRVLIVDDSSTARTLLRGVLQSDEEIKIVGEASNGEEAVELAKRLRPDLITMDVNMPVMGGLDATKAIMADLPTPILVVSAIERAALDLSFDAMRAGALMVVKKPAGPGDARFTQDREQLLSMVKAMSGVKVVRRRGARESGVNPQPAIDRGSAGKRVIVIGTSTGGPAALQRLLVDLPREFPVPVMAVQHIARGFVGGLASWLDGATGLRVVVAEHGDELKPGFVYLAPDDRHLGVTSRRRVALSDEPPVAGFRPSATHLFRSAAAAFGPGVIAAVLTGMGSDGVEGLRDVRTAGGCVLAQDERSSVVFGMAQEALREGLCDSVLSLDRLAERLVELVS